MAAREQPLQELTPPVGCLLLCATPIGNLEDITLRSLRYLKEADCIAAENEGHTRKLLSHYAIGTRTVSYREENREAQGAYLLALMERGRSVALVSDAGMPGISDPGVHLVCLCHERGIPVICAPGPSSVLMALVLSGFATSPFIFLGFPPEKKSKREHFFKALGIEERTAVIFEGPHHLRSLLVDLAPHVGGRSICVLREMTKIHEEIRRGTAGELSAHYEKVLPRGEIVVVLEGAALCAEGEPQPEESSLENLLEGFLSRGYRLREAAKAVAAITGVPARQVYECGLEVKKKLKEV